MKPKKIVLILATVIILSAISVACSKAQVTTEPVVSPAPTQSTGKVTEQTKPPTAAPTGAPEDVPIMPDAYELQVSNALNVIYKVKAQTKDVVSFYQQELPNAGWTVAKNPDSVVGNMAQMTRDKENGDRITFSIQYNPMGEFTVVQIFLTRAP